MKARIPNSLSERCASACPLRHTCTREEKHRERRVKKQAREFRQKRREIFLRSRGESKESPQLFSRISSISFFNPFSFNKIMLIRKKAFIFALDKTQPSLLLAALRCPHSANRRAFPDETTQTIFDLPKTMMPFSDLAASNRHTVSQSVQPWSFPFISTTLCDKCSKRNSYFCPKQNIRIPTLCRQPSLEFRARAARIAEGGPRHTTTA